MPENVLDTTFKNWIDKTGMENVSKLLEVHFSTVYFWSIGRCLPRAHQMKKIKDITNGKVDYKHIIEGSCSPLKQ